MFTRTPERPIYGGSLHDHQSLDTTFSTGARVNSGGLTEAHAEEPVSEAYAEPACTHRTFRRRKTTGTRKHQEST